MSEEEPTNSPRKRNVLSIFYGYPVELIKRWCRVSSQTAYAYKSGARLPSPRTAYLFTLHKRGKILGDAWRGWSVRDDKLFDPEGNEITQGQLRAYYIVYQLAHAKHGGDVWDLLKQYGIGK